MDDVKSYEILWRSVPPFGVKSDGRAGLVLSSQAFNDPYLKPSVDRSNIRVFKEWSLRGPGHGLVALSVAEIRSITDIQSNPPKKTPQHHAIDVMPDPIVEDVSKNIPANPSHALITPLPEITSKNTFERLKESLARLAEKRGWLMPPNYTGTTTPIVKLVKIESENFK